ncbi:MAG: mechanosensitive ion channel family protein, partial [Methanocorpusculum sp.]|nr:mechanosensitive ion channel family protein [Methanocorpusculum sp.]
MIDVNTLLPAGITLGIGLALAFGVFLFRRITLARLKPGLKTVIIKALSLPIILIILVTTFYGLSQAYFSEYVPIPVMYYSAVCILLGTWAAYRTTLSCIDCLVPGTKPGSKKVVPLTKFILRILIWVVGLFMILSALEVDITPLLASAGVIGIAVALAAQDLLSNIFGGVVLYTDVPFNEDDWVSISGNYGKVIHVGLRSTRIMTGDNQLMTIPNSSVSSNVIINYSKPSEYMTIRETIGVEYGSDVALVKKTLLDAVTCAMGNTPYFSCEAKPDVNFMEFADSSLNFELSFISASPQVKRKAIDAVNTEIDRLFKERGIGMPFPQRVVTLVKNDTN